MPAKRTYLKTSIHVLCPYYIANNSLDIRCNALLDKERYVTHSFKSKTAAEEYMYNFCQYAWEGCDHAIQCKRRYEENEQMEKAH